MRLTRLFPTILIILIGITAFAQNTDAPATVFPEALLNGMVNFDVAFFIQGDIRGNVAPCG